MASSLLYLCLPLLLSISQTQIRSRHTLIKNLQVSCCCSSGTAKNSPTWQPPSVTLSGHHVDLSHLDHIPLERHSSLFSDLKASSSLCHSAFAQCHFLCLEWSSSSLLPLPQPSSCLPETSGPSWVVSFWKRSLMPWTGQLPNCSWDQRSLSCSLCHSCKFIFPCKMIYFSFSHWHVRFLKAEIMCIFILLYNPASAQCQANSRCPENVS